MSGATLTTRLAKEALARHGLALERPALLRRVSSLLKETTPPDEAKVELVVRWVMAQEQERFRMKNLTFDKFYAVAHTIDCPDGAWAYRLWEYELALEGDPEKRRLISSITYWLDYWTDAALVYDDDGVEYAQESLGILRSNHA